MIRLVLIALSPGLLILLAAVQSRWKSIQGVARNLMVTYITLLLFLAAGEIYFRYVYAESENVLATWSTQNWLARHWQTNSLGYRDREWQPEDWHDKTTVMLVGDSFAAGWGLENPEDRFGNVLADLLGDEYALLNLGEYGRSTPEELDNLKSHPLQDPDIVILQYFLNDISYAQLRLGLQLPVTPTPFWAHESAMLNFVYFRFYPIFEPDAPDWQNYDFEAYDNVTIWELHREEIEAFIAYVDSIDAELIVVIFPNMMQPFRSIPYVDRVAQVFEANGETDILKLFDAANAWSLEDRIVSSRDTHASAAFNRYVAEELYARFFAD